MNEVLLIAGMAIVTFLIRYPVLALSGRIKLSPRFLQALSYVPPAVLTAIVVPAVLMPECDRIQFSYENARLIGAIAAVAIGVWRKNLLLTILVGMLVFFGWQGILRIGTNNPVFAITILPLESIARLPSESAGLPHSLI